MSLAIKLSSLIEEWLAAGRQRNLQMLANKSGVSYSTVRRIAQGEVDPGLSNTISIVSAILPKDKALALVNEHFPETAGLLSREAAHKVETLDEISDIDDFNRDDFLVLSLAATSAGVTQSKVQTKLGERGLQSLDKLLAAGVLQKEGSSFKAIKDRFNILGLNLLLSEMHWIIDAFDKKLIDRFGSFVSLNTQGLNVQGIKDAHKVLCEAEKALTTITNDPARQGGNVMAFGIVSTYLDAEKGEI